LKESEQEL
jgi:hypothetical protein